MTHSISEINNVRLTGWLLEDMVKREAFGLKKYNRYVLPFNGRNALQDAYEEVLDLCVYLKQALLEEMGREAASDVESVWKEVMGDLVNFMDAPMDLNSFNVVYLSYLCSLKLLYSIKLKLVLQENEKCQ